MIFHSVIRNNRNQLPPSASRQDFKNTVLLQFLWVGEIFMAVWNSNSLLRHPRPVDEHECQQNPIDTLSPISTSIHGVWFCVLLRSRTNMQRCHVSSSETCCAIRSKFPFATLPRSMRLERSRNPASGFPSRKKELSRYKLCLLFCFSTFKITTTTST